MSTVVGVVGVTVVVVVVVAVMGVTVAGGGGGGLRELGFPVCPFFKISHYSPLTPLRTGEGRRLQRHGNFRCCLFVCDGNKFHDYNFWLKFPPHVCIA